MSIAAQRRRKSFHVKVIKEHVFDLNAYETRLSVKRDTIQQALEAKEMRN